VSRVPKPNPVKKVRIAAMRATSDTRIMSITANVKWKCYRSIQNL
jgi:hypothetical protein